MSKDYKDYREPMSQVECFFTPLLPELDVRAYMATQILAGMWAQPGYAETFMAAARQLHPEAIIEFAYKGMAQNAIDQAQALLNQLANQE